MTRGNLLPLARERAMILKTFATEALADYKTTAAVAPSSSHLAQAMLEPVPLRWARTVVELGAGTGVMTQALLDSMPRHATLIVFEISHRFYTYLQQKFSDPRLVLLNSNAENVYQELRRRGLSRVDGVVSSLGLSFMSDDQRHALLSGLVPFLDDKGVFTQYQYIHGMQFVNGRLQRFSVEPLLRRYFGSVESRIVWRNLPPAFVFACRKTAA